MEWEENKVLENDISSAHDLSTDGAINEIVEYMLKEVEGWRRGEGNKMGSGGDAEDRKRNGDENENNQEAEAIRDLLKVFIAENGKDPAFTELC